MRRFLAMLTAAILSGWACTAVADMDLLKKNNCIACHAAESDIFGPALKKVAAKYKGDAGAEVRLAKKIRAGGSGVWGDAPMPPQPQVSEADAQVLATYILSIR